MASTDTATRILDIAERLVQTRGFNGFSYADIAGDLGITKAALHYHFAGKAELGGALIERYTTRFGERLAEIDASGADAPAKLAEYADIYASVLREAGDELLNRHLRELVCREISTSFDEDFDPDTKALGIELLVETGTWGAPQVEIEDV